MNNNGQPRICKFFHPVHQEGFSAEDAQQQVIRKVFQQVAQRPDSFCNYLEGCIPEWGDSTKLIYRHYATLYFVFAVDQLESDLGILDLIQGGLAPCLPARFECTRRCPSLRRSTGQVL